MGDTNIGGVKVVENGERWEVWYCPFRRWFLVLATTNPLTAKRIASQILAERNRHWSRSSHFTLYQVYDLVEREIAAM